MSGADLGVPRVIYSLWFDGEAKAPEVVRLAYQRWVSLNPGYELRVQTMDDVSKLVIGIGIPTQVMTIETLTSIVSARLLLNGGVWVDASVFPTQPLDTWLPDRLQGGGFFAFKAPGVDRPLSSWFLAASPDHVIMQKWWEAVVQFWATPRKLARYAGGIVPADPVWEVSPSGGAMKPEFPYFWFEYLFAYLLQSDTEFASQWSRCGTAPWEPAHRLQGLFESGQPGPYDIIKAARGAPVHKLDWRNTYPIDLLEVF
jgi:hypothetical protein